MNNQKINWFPGHMKKAVDELKSTANKIDFVIEVVDARAIKSSSNQELITYFNNKPIIQVALKADLSDLNQNNQPIILVNTKNHKQRQLIIKRLFDLFQPKINKLKTKGLIKPTFVGIVVGLPNIGKSSLINFLTNHHKLKVENKSGVTKNQSLTKINDCFYLIDTPGIFFKQVDDNTIGYQLAILNCINKEIIPFYEVLQYCYDYFDEYYPKELTSYFQLNEHLNFDQFIEFICNRYQFKNNENLNDLNRCYHFLFNEFSLSKICKFHFR